MVFPRKDIRNYDPYAADDRAKCISVVNATGKSSAIISALDGRRVIAHGKVVDYDTLTDSSNPAERLLGRKYYGDEFVPNFCLRQFVFVASSLEAAD